MATLTQILHTTAKPFLRQSLAQVQGWAQENLYATPLKAAGNVLMLAVAGLVFLGQWRSAPALAAAIGVLWLLGLLWVVVGSLRHRLDPLGEWLKDRLYNSLASALITLIITLWATAAVRALFNWAIANASFATDPRVAKASEHTGATWGVIAANLKLFLVGQFPRGELWRVWASLALVVVMAGLSVLAYFIWPRRRPFRRAVTLLWLFASAAVYLLLRGSRATGPLDLVDTRLWGGLLLTLVITLFAIVVSFPLGVLLALGRRSRLPGIPAWLTYGAAGLIALWGLREYTLANWSRGRQPLEYVFLLWPVWLLLVAFLFQHFYQGNVVAAVSTVFIEFVRGVPLITILFMAQHILPLFLPARIDIEDAYRAMWGFAFFTAAYLAENVRGGLQSVPRGQYEAAQALGLNTLQQLRFVILPQALRVVIPPNTGLYIGIFKDTSLVAIMGLFDLLNIANAVIAQPDWLGLRPETFFFITVIYYLGCYAIAFAGRWLEKRSGLGER